MFSMEHMVMNLKSMTIDALMGLRAKIDAVLNSKVAGERRALETELAKLTRFESGSRAKTGDRPRRTGQGGAQIPQPGKPQGNLGGPWA